MIHKIALILVIVGGLNWGLMGLNGTNLVANIITNSGLLKLVYDLIGLSALYVAFMGWKR